RGEIGMVVRKVIVRRGRRTAGSRPGGTARSERQGHCVTQTPVRFGATSAYSTGRVVPGARTRLRARFTALVVGMVAVLLLFAGEIGAPGVIELGVAAALLGGGLAASGWCTWLGQPPELVPASTPCLDAD